MVTTSISVGQATSHDAAAWDAFVQSQRASGYHRWAWRSIFERAFGHDTSYLIARDRDRVVGVLPLVNGTLLVSFLSTLVGFPLGVGVAIYLS